MSRLAHTPTLSCHSPSSPQPEAERAQPCHCAAAMKNVRARPRRIPAFGEWNYYDHGGYGYADGDWPVTQYFESAMEDGGLVFALPASPPPKPVKKAVTWKSSGTLEMDVEQGQQKVVVGLREQHGTKKQSRVSDAGSHMSSANYKQTRRAVKAVDEDLYVIPPDMLCHKPRKRLAKSLWIGGCLGLSCVA